jgi:hypothetical protein
MKSVTTRTRSLLGGCLSLLLLGATAGAEDLALLPEVLGTSQFYAADPNSGLALGGRDPVVYQIEGTPRGGVRGQETLWGGVAWRFASEANRAAFLRSPELFAPRIGGYDAEAAAQGRLVEASPDIFLLRAGRLYLFRTDASRERFKASAEAASRAEANWPKLQGVLVRG